MGDQFADEVAVRLARWERAVPGVVVEKLVRIREVEVSCEKERVGEFARLVHERMAESRFVFPERGVAQMSEENPLE